MTAQMLHDASPPVRYLVSSGVMDVALGGVSARVAYALMYALPALGVLGAVAACVCVRAARRRRDAAAWTRFLRGRGGVGSPRTDAGAAAAAGGAGSAGGASLREHTLQNAAEIALDVRTSGLVFSEIHYSTPAARGRPPRHVLRGASGAVPSALFAILGPSGAGKTTLLDILAGRKSGVYSGEIVRGGRDCYEIWFELI